MTTGDRFCFYHLHNPSHGKVIAKRVNPEEVEVTLPDERLRIHTLPVDARDFRILVCFDGDIPSGGLPKGSTVLMELPVVSSSVTSPLVCHMEKAYKQRHVTEDPPRYAVRGNQAEQPITRYFVLLKTGRAVFRKYKKTLQPVYLIVDVHDGIAEFSTSSY